VAEVAYDEGSATTRRPADLKAAAARAVYSPQYV
jgi:hypothetical protein